MRKECRDCLLDGLFMKYLMIEDYSDFECIGDKCPISCCGGGWGIVIDEKTAAYYQNLEGEFGDYIRQHIFEHDGITAFALDENGDCPLLNENKLCRIYRELGEDKMCHTCKTYPRNAFTIGDLNLRYLTTSCPEVVRRIIERTEPVQIDLVEQPNNKMQELKLKKMNWKRFNSAIRAYTSGMDLLQNRDLDLRSRVRLLLLYTYQFEGMNKTKENTDPLIELFSMPDMYKGVLAGMPDEVDYSSRIRIFSIVFSLMLRKSYDHPMWTRCREMAERIKEISSFSPEVLKQAFRDASSHENEIEMEQLITYRFFSAYMKGFEKNSYYDRIILSVVAYYVALMTYSAVYQTLYNERCTTEDRILFFSLCSRIDHSDQLVEKLNNELKTNGYFELDKIMNVI